MFRTLIEIKPRDVPFSVALRNAAGFVLPLGIGIATGHTTIGLGIATGALNTMFTDQPGPYRLRMQRMALAATAAGVSALIGIAIGAHSIAFVAAAFVLAFGGGMLVALGPIAARVGLTSMIVMMVTADMHLPPSNAPAVAGLIFAGGALQMLLAVAAWPLQRYRPERFALAGVLRQLASVARSRPDASQRPPVSQAALDALAGDDVLEHGERVGAGRHQLGLLALELLGDRALAAQPFPEVGAARDHAAVARRCADAEHAALQHHRIDAVAPQLERGRQPAIARADDHHLRPGRRVLRQRVVGRPGFPPPGRRLEVGMEDLFAGGHLGTLTQAVGAAAD